MKHASTGYFKRDENRKYFLVMVFISFVFHAAIFVFLASNTGHAGRPDIFIASYAPVKLVGSVSVASPKAPEVKKTEPPRTEPQPKPEPPKPDTSKGPPVINKGKKSKPPKKPPPSKEPASPPSKSEPDTSNMVPFTAGTGTGQSLGGIMAGSEQFQYNWYVDMVTFRIQRNWSPPFEAGKIGKTLKTVILFEILRDGSLGNIRVEESSGSQKLDEAAQNAIRGSFPVDPLPRGFPDNILRLHFYIIHTF